VESLLGDQEWVKWSDRRVAEQAAVSVNFVATMRKELSSDDSSSKAADQPRIGRDGKSRRQPRTRGRIQLTPSRIFDHDNDNDGKAKASESPPAPPPSPFAFLADTASDLCSILPKVITAWELAEIGNAIHASGPVRRGRRRQLIGGRNTRPRPQATNHIFRHRVAWRVQLRL
jgi:hypothetical protein